MRKHLTWIMPPVLAACAPPPAVVPPPVTVPAFLAAEIDIGPDGRCFGRDESPAVIETTTAQELVSPAEIGPDGSVITPAVYRSTVRQDIVQERAPVAFETLCPPAYTAEFVASVQRALAARGLFAGPVNGALDPATLQAIRAFQQDTGPDSALLSIAAARALGLVALSLEQIDALQ
jgi:Putative peptidoglycan binding domain